MSPFPLPKIPLPPNQCFHLLTITNLASICPALLHSLSRLSSLSCQLSSTYFPITSLVLSQFDPGLLFVSAPVRSPTLCSWLRELPPVSYSLPACSWSNPTPSQGSGFSNSSPLNYCSAGVTPAVTSYVYGGSIPQGLRSGSFVLPLDSRSYRDTNSLSSPVSGMF